MRKVTWLPLAIVLICGSAAGADLNAPAHKTITIGSELERGHNVAADCSSHSQYWDGFSDCVERSEQAENRKNTDTDAFKLGLYAAALTKLTAMESASLASGHTVGSLMLLTGKQWFSSVSYLQKRLGVSDSQLAPFAGASPARLNSIKKHWAAQVAR